jgi:two-component system response regulator HydG
VVVAHGGAEAIALIRRETIDLVITDLRMERVDGFDVLEAVRQIGPGTPVLIMTAFGAIESAIEAMRRGAYHYFAKPFQLDEVLLNVERALGEQRLRDENRMLKRAVERSSFGRMIGRGRAMRALFELVERVARSQATVLIRGESGTGKELVARAIHAEGPRREQSFVPINCANVPESLLESELFGHVKGAFTGAAAARRGLFAEADGGTLFLDEIGEMPLGFQAKLLRVLEDREVRPVGSDGARKVDVRVICATHRDLEQLVRQGKFREDLLYRLNVVTVDVPPLRERAEDIPPLVEHFLSVAQERNPHSPVRRIAPAALAALSRSSFPGNVRQLENVIERLVIVCSGEEVSLADIEQHAAAALAGPSPIIEAREKLPTLRQLEDDYIAWVIGRCGGNKSKAAETLGIDASTIHRRERERSG